MNAVEEVQRIGKAYGFTPTEQEANVVLWEHTGFPSFWPNPSIPGHWNLRRQVRQFFRNARNGCTKCARCGLVVENEYIEFGLCGYCNNIMEKEARRWHVPT